MEKSLYSRMASVAGVQELGERKLEDLAGTTMWGFGGLRKGFHGSHERTQSWRVTVS